MWNNGLGSDEHIPYTRLTDPGAGSPNLRLYNISSTSSMRTTAQDDGLAPHPDILPSVPDASSTTPHELLDRTVPLHPLVHDVDTSDNPTSDAMLPNKRKRKPTGMKKLSRKRLTDLYSKRSMTLVEKGRELTEMTDAFIVVYAARPESVGEGTHRLFVSKNLQEADGTLANRLLDTVNTVASGVASLSRRSRPGPNKARTRDTQRAYGFAVEGPGSQAAHQVVPSHAASTPRAVSVNQPTLTSDGPSMMELSLEGEIAPIVLLLKNNSKDVQAYALSVIKKLVLSDRGVTVVHDANAVPRLIELLDPNPEWGYDIACQSLLVLSHMANHQRPCMEMVKAGVIPPLGRLLSHPVDEDNLVLVVRTISRCSRQFHRGKVFRSLFLPEVLPLLIGLLSSSQTQVWVGAAEAIYHIADVEDYEILQYLVDEGVAQQLCHLFSNCTDLLALEKLASAIGRIARLPGNASDDDIHAIQEHVIQPLLILLGHHSIEDQIRACRVLSLCQSHKLAQSLAEDIIIPELVPLLSSDNDELFVAAAWAWVVPMSLLVDTGLEVEVPAYISCATFRRLIHLLSCNDKLVVANAARCIDEFTFVCCMSELSYGLFYEMLDLGGLRRLVDLISSHNMDLAKAAAIAITSLHDRDRGMGPIYRRLGIITAIVRFATSGLHPPADLHELFYQVNILEFGEDEAKALAQADLIVPLVHVLSSREGSGNLYLVHTIHRLAVLDPSYRVALLDAGIARPLTDCLSYLLGGFGIDHYDYLEARAVRYIVEFMEFSAAYRLAFKAAGVERVLSDFLADGQSSKYREEVEDAYASLLE